uniref:Uncharacterized protein n=1 Tax=Anguilla anguilla TaxID=7936 RepID=A0A0E9XDW7_ANGAN
MQGFSVPQPLRSFVANSEVTLCGVRSSFYISIL